MFVFVSQNIDLLNRAIYNLGDKKEGEMIKLSDNQRKWAKTLLIIYPRTKKILKALSNTGTKIARDGFSCTDVTKLFDRVADINYRMQGIANLYVLTRDVLGKIGVTHAEILIMRHVQVKGVADIAELLGTSVRNVYRKYDRALEVFYRYIASHGYGEEWLSGEYSADPLVSGIFRRADGNIFVERANRRRKKESMSVPVRQAERKAGVA